jgi:NAD(P)-dependent dehydrogenase (short-subunit alcohol dehydrogenase family)
MFESKFSLQGKKILVTGASSGIGKETAILLSNLGASLVICGRHENRLNETLNGLNKDNQHSVFAGDLTKETTLDLLISQIDKIDGVVCSAGVMNRLPFKFLTAGELQSTMQINFESPVILCQKIIKSKKINKGGSIVFVSSIAGNVIADKGISAYAASKGALNAVCKVLAIEVAPLKVRANCITPGMVWSPLTQDGEAPVSEQDLKTNEQLYPLGYGTPGDVAYGISYLLSDASKWMTGNSLVIDGGFSIQ